MTTKTYYLPMVGTIINWETFSGDPNDPVRPLGAREFMRSLEEDSPLLEGGVQVKAKYYNVDEGIVEVDIIANELFHAAFEEWLEEKTPQDICAMYEKEQLIIQNPKERGLEDRKPSAQFLTMGHL